MFLIISRLCKCNLYDLQISPPALHEEEKFLHLAQNFTEGQAAELHWQKRSNREGGGMWKKPRVTCVPRPPACEREAHINILNFLLEYSRSGGLPLFVHGRGKSCRWQLQLLFKS